MPVTLIITKTLDPESWGSDAELAELDDASIIDLAREDLAELFDGATITVKRIPARPQPPEEWAITAGWPWPGADVYTDTPTE